MLATGRIFATLNVMDLKKVVRKCIKQTPAQLAVYVLVKCLPYFVALQAYGAPTTAPTCYIKIQSHIGFLTPNKTLFPSATVTQFSGQIPPTLLQGKKLSMAESRQLEMLVPNEKTFLITATGTQYYLIFRFDLGKPQQDRVAVALKINIPSQHNTYSCTQLIQTLQNFKNVRAMTNFVYKKISHQTIGENLIALEGISGQTKGEAYATEKIKASYLKLLADARNSVALTKGGRGKFTAIRQTLIDHGLSSYCRDARTFRYFFEANCGNCETQTLLFISLASDLGLYGHDEWQLGVEVFADHLRPVLVKGPELIDLVYGTIEPRGPNPIISPQKFIESYLAPHRDWIIGDIKNHGVQKLPLGKTRFLLSEPPEFTTISFENSLNAPAPKSNMPRSSTPAPTAGQHRVKCDDPVFEFLNDNEKADLIRIRRTGSMTSADRTNYGDLCPGTHFSIGSIFLDYSDRLHVPKEVVSNINLSLPYNEKLEKIYEAYLNHLIEEAQVRQRNYRAGLRTAFENRYFAGDRIFPQPEHIKKQFGLRSRTRIIEKQLENEIFRTLQAVEAFQLRLVQSGGETLNFLNQDEPWYFLDTLLILIRKHYYQSLMLRSKFSEDEIKELTFPLRRPLRQIILSDQFTLTMFPIETPVGQGLSHYTKKDPLQINVPTFPMSTEIAAEFESFCSQQKGTYFQRGSIAWECKTAANQDFQIPSQFLLSPAAMASVIQEVIDDQVIDLRLWIRLAAGINNFSELIENGDRINVGFEQIFFRAWRSSYRVLSSAPYYFKIPDKCLSNCPIDPKALTVELADLTSQLLPNWIESTFDSSFFLLARQNLLRQQLQAQPTALKPNNMCRLLSSMNYIECKTPEYLEFGIFRIGQQYVSGLNH